MVAPAYVQDSYVDHELSTNLDSTYAFEGPEKVLEVWLYENENQLSFIQSSEGLRCIPLEKWVRILDLVNCKILSMKSNSHMDAYLLSESSLFVFAHKVILKTCGTTTTLACLDQLFSTINEYCFAPNDSSFNSKNCFRTLYSRRSFMFPDRQIHVHRDWKSETNLLNKFFANGKSYIVGDSLSDDHWYLYQGGKDSSTKEVIPKMAHAQTFEVLMTELDPECAAQFVTDRKPGMDDGTDEDHDLGHDMGLCTMQNSGLDSIFAPTNASSLGDSLYTADGKLLHDAFSFTPCGFSSNTMGEELGGYYYTLHITPENGWSYASFETSYPFLAEKAAVGVVEVLVRILGIFKPGKFSLNFSTSDIDTDERVKRTYCALKSCDPVLNKLGYQKLERVAYDMKHNCNLLYLNFKKRASE
ncbi:spermidine resistance protein [Scheffersomyces spartinae]|uniref:adenosylmethionine decarboxylase n=1 Tax=Scheffersomyces spartinae TaxID=45513 RepID=A0A9P7VD02_9ASCO|nr:spermidine resistance protein [Scheffersomyces spartinae]KAG7195246.1 spermidine resistance protein [Scheffersomyces spartinae]